MVRCLLDSRCCQLTSPPQAHRGTVCMCRAEGWGGIYVWGYTGHGIYGIDISHPVSDRQIALCSPLPLCSWPVPQCHMPHWSFWNISITSREQHTRKRPCPCKGRRHRILLTLQFSYTIHYKTKWDLSWKMGFYLLFGNWEMYCVEKLYV